MSALDRLLEFSCHCGDCDECELNEAGLEELAQLRNRIAELEENAKLFIKYIKNGENQKSHLQMLVLESCLTKSPEPPKEAK
jgi:hypothetical protein